MEAWVRLHRTKVGVLAERETWLSGAEDERATTVTDVIAGADDGNQANRQIEALFRVWHATIALVAALSARVRSCHAASAPSLQNIFEPSDAIARKAEPRAAEPARPSPTRG